MNIDPAGPGDDADDSGQDLVLQHRQHPGRPGRGVAGVRAVLRAGAAGWPFLTLGSSGIRAVNRPTRLTCQCSH